MLVRKKMSLTQNMCLLILRCKGTKDYTRIKTNHRLTERKPSKLSRN